MRVCVISPFINGKPHLATLPTSKDKILNFIGSICDRYNFIVLAGYNAMHYPNEVEVQTELLKQKQSLATVFIETGGMQHQNHSPSNKAFFVSANAIKAMPEQIFSKTKKQKLSPNDVLALQKYLYQRFHTILTQEVLLLICGEVDAFKHKNNNIHHGIPLNWQSANIIINPTYTPRSTGFYLPKKLRNLSTQQRVVIYNVNNNQNHASKNIRNTIKIFFDEREFIIVPELDFNLDIVHRLTWFPFEIGTDNLGNKEMYHIDKNHNPTKNVIGRKTYK
jgi:hypothetical protein